MATLNRRQCAARLKAAAARMPIEAAALVDVMQQAASWLVIDAEREEVAAAHLAALDTEVRREEMAPGFRELMEEWEPQSAA